MQPGDIISYTELILEENAHLQRGMNFRLHGKHSVILMSTRLGAPYNDSIMDEGKTIIYEGHDVSKNGDNPFPKRADQPYQINGKLTQNGLFYDSAKSNKKESVRVYEKIRDGIWVFNGLFKLTDAWQESDGTRNVFKFKLELVNISDPTTDKTMNQLEINNTRIIPSYIKKEVWKRDDGKCKICGSTENLHFDHIIPYTKGGSSLVVENIQILCARHNLQKSDKIE